MALIEESRIDVRLVPARALIEAARERGIELHTEPEEDDSVVLSAGERWRELIDVSEDFILRLWRRIPFTMQAQLQSQWCWAATSVSVRLYYTPSSSWTQCEMVNQERGQTTCCTDGSTDACNQPNVLDSPLSRANVLERMESGTVDYAAIKGEIDAGRPLAWRIGWAGGGGHFAVMEGYRRFGTPFVAVDDPIWGNQDVELSVLTGGTYQGTGSWTHTYFTKRPLRLFIPPDKVRIPRLIWDELQPVGPGGGGS